MNEVEKMYRNSSIEKHKKTMQDIETGKDVLTLDSFYPEFTAEKQLELIKWMIKTNHRYFIQDIIADDFSETLAGVFNLYWQDLTDAERTQIKEILE